MRQSEHFLRVITTIAFLAHALPGRGEAAEAPARIIAELQDGRSVHGEVDLATNNNYLWLRKEVAGIQLRSGHAWQRVRRLRYEDREYSAQQFLLEVGQLATPAKQPAEIPPYPGANSVAPPSVAGYAETLPPPQRANVASLQIEACLGQWDNDAEPDGLWVVLYPFTADGMPIPVHGQLDLTLLGELEPAIGGRSDLVRPQFQELSRTSELVHVQDFARGPAVVRLPFRQFQPEQNPDISRQALVQARLGISGQGVFEAVDANVQLRGDSRIRDQLQLHTGKRFFPAERVPTPLR